VPVPGGGFETDVLFGREMALQHADQADGQEDRADDDVEAVEAGRHEERRAIDVAGKAEGGVAVFIGLEVGEQEAQEHGQDQAVLQVLAVVFMDQRMVGPGRGATRQQQDQRVDQRQVPGVEGLDALGRPDAIDQRAHRPHRVKRVLEEGPEPGREEHDFRHDEHDEAIAQADADDRGMVAGLAFMHHVCPPAEHDIQHAHQPDQAHPRTRAVHPQHRAEQHDEGRDRTGQRPDRRGQDVVIVVLCVGHLFPRFFCQFTGCTGAGASSAA